MRLAETSTRAEKTGSTDRRRRKERSGRLAELLAAFIMTAKGYRVLARRARTPFGEIDLIAVRGQRLAFIEVKYRDRAMDPGAAVARRQAIRIARAAEQWAWSHPAYRNHRFGLDIIVISPWRWPRHLVDGLQPL
jgi:putative endonuclease